MKQILSVEINSENNKSYDINISDEDLSSLKLSIDKITGDRKRLFVFSKKVYKLYKDIFNFDKKEILILNDGEKEKNFKNVDKKI